MDPVSLGASAVAFLGVGIHAARALHAILSGIKDGPENVKRASDSVWGLVPILEDLARRRALGQDGKAVLERRLLMCVEDLEGFASKIDRISLSDSERRRGKYWKKVRMVFSEKALATMCAVTSGHVAAINLQLNVMSSDAVFAMPDQLNEIKQAVLAQRTDGAESLAALINQKATIGELLTEVSRIGNGVDTVQQTITTLTAARLTTNDETRDMVHQILRLAMGLSAGSAGAKTETADANHCSQNEKRSRAEKSMYTLLEEDLVRLCNLATDSQDRAPIGGGDAMLERLLSIFGIMCSDRFLDYAMGLDQASQYMCNKDRLTCKNQLRSTLRSVYSMFLSTQKIILNEVESLGSHCSSHWRIWIFDFGIGHLLITRKEFSSGQGFPDFQSSGITTSISFLPTSRHQVQKALKVSATHNYGVNGVFSAIPRISMYNIIPDGSPVFRIVSEGRLSELRQLLQSGKASLRDMDECGNTLLFVSSRPYLQAIRLELYITKAKKYSMNQPTMCQFLIESGVDVNYVATNYEGFLTNALWPLHNCRTHDRGNGSIVMFKASLSCYKLILDAGCESSMKVVHRTGSVKPMTTLELFMRSGIVEVMRVVIDHGDGSMNINSSKEHNLMLQHCRHGCWSEEGIQVLLDRGFDIHDSDEDGRTPLQNCFNGNVHLGEFTSNPRWIGASRVRSLANGIITLIQHGADIHGIDYLGHSVSHKAYHPKHGDSGLWDDDGSLRGDLWDYALTMCGYDISEFGGAYCRRARYTKRYRRADFEALWEGNEHLCPYFNSRKCRCARHSLGQEMDDSSDWVSTSEDEDECEMGDYEEHDWESEVCSSLSWDSEYEDQLSSDSESDGSDMDHNCIDQEDTSSDASESGWETDDSESGPTL